MAVYVSNLTVNTGTTFSQIFTLESADTNSATDLTGFTATAQMRKHPGASSATDFTTQIINASGDGSEPKASEVSIILNSGENNEI